MSRVKFATSIEEELLKKIKILGVQHDRNTNEMLEEAILDLLKKYEKKNQVKKL